MKSFSAYEHNLDARLKELRSGDRAYTIHGDAILETLTHGTEDETVLNSQRILDVGCGLGFISLKMAQIPYVYVLGTDPSKKAIDLAKKEHAIQPNLEFMAVSAQELPKQMKKHHIQAFDRAILNMVLHSVDDQSCAEILNGIRLSLKPHGVLTCIVPGQEWLIDKLIEKAKSSGMNKEDGIPWIRSQLQKQAIDLAVGINGQPAYDEPITIYNRRLSDYGNLLKENGYGLDVNVSSPRNSTSPQTIKTAYWEWSDYMNGYELSTRDRHILMTQAR